MSQAPNARWLLIGNSRWHWAERSPDGQLSGWDEAPPARGEEGHPPLTWAAVGPPPDPAWAPADRQVDVGDVPLTGCPPWLGIDRALAGWGAWRESAEAVLVADAGTVLSLTLVDASGHFRGGRLLAGLALQLEAMGNRTALLPRLPATDTGEWEAEEGDGTWPRATADAMRVGVETALVAAVVEAARASGSRRLVLTGGDGGRLWQRVRKPLEERGHTVLHRPLLCLESLSRLRPGLSFRPDPDP
ncbi:MAG: type III pantothenate kinase [Cyanobacteriota bacterium]